MKKASVVLVLVLVLVLDLVSAAAAPLVTPPAGWKGGADIELVQITGGAGHLGGQHGIVEAESYKPTDKLGLVLDVARITVTTSSPALAAKAELESLKHPTVAVDDSNKWIAATVEQSDDVHQRTRIVLVATKDRIVEVQADCIANDVAVSAWDPCLKALETIDAGVDAKDRVMIELAASGGGSSTSTSTSTTGMSSMSDGSRVPMPPIVVKPDTSSPPTDKRPFFVGAGIVLLAVVFWWNRRRRERFAQEERGDAPKEYQ